MRKQAWNIAVMVSLAAGSALPFSVRADEAPPPEAPAEEPADDPAVAGARDTINEVMALIEKAKWKDLKGRYHPHAMKAIEERKTRAKRDNHNLSFWTHVKEWKFKTWEVASIQPGPRSTAIVTTREDHFMIEEKGVDEGRQAQWLLVKSAPDGKEARWWVLDRRNGTGNFTNTSIVKGFSEALPEETGAADEAPQTPMAVYQARLEKAVRAKLKMPEGIPETQLKVMTATVRIMLNESGTILSRSMDRPSGNPQFDKAIIRAIDAAQPLPPPDDAVAEEARKGVLVTFKGKE